MTRRINRGNKYPNNNSNKTAEKIKAEKKKREERRLQIKLDRDGR